MNTSHASRQPRASRRSAAVAGAVLLTVAAAGITAAGITAFERNAAHATRPVAAVKPVTATDASLPAASDVFKSQPAHSGEDLPPTF